jgi:hypothetical protein
MLNGNRTVRHTHTPLFEELYYIYIPTILTVIYFAIQDKAYL